MNTFDLTLDLDKRFDNAPVRMRQGDKSGTTIRAAIYDHGELLSGNFTVRYVQAIVGHDHRYYRETGVLANGIATVTVDETYAAAVAGSTFGYFQILQGSAVIASTQSFAVHVLPDATYQAEVGEKYDSAIEDALAELDEATGRISQMVIDATAEYLEAHPELTTTVEDNSLTDAKLIQHGGILDRVARLWHRLDNLLTATPAESDSLTVTDAAKTPLAGLALYGRSAQDGTPTPSAPVAIQSVVPQLFEVTASTQTINGVTFTPQSDGTVLVNGTATGSAFYTAGTVTLPAGTYVLAGYADGALVTATTHYRIYVNGSGVTANSGTPFTATQSVTLTVYVQAISGQTFNAETLGIALWQGSEPMHYVPYNSVALWARGKNLWSYGNHTFTRYTRVNFDTPFPAGTYTVSALVTSADTDASTSTFTFRDANDIAVGSATLTRNSRASDVVTIARPATYCYLYSSTGASPSTGDEATWADIQVEQGSTATAYQPYAESTTPIDLDGHELRSLPDGTRDELRIDAAGNVTLVQRVGYVVFDGTYSNMSFIDAAAMGGNCTRITLRSAVFTNMVGTTLNSNTCYCTHAVYGSTGATAEPPAGHYTRPANSNGYLTLPATLTSGMDAKAWLTSNPVTFYLPLDVPVETSLGAVTLPTLPAPDLTAWAAQGATFELTYERDLNTTLARLEAAIADAATA